MDEWLRDLEIVAGSRRYPNRHLLYQGVVHEGRVRLEGLVDDPTVQQVQVEHYAGKDLVQIKVVPLRRNRPEGAAPFTPYREGPEGPGRFFCYLDLRRGHNDIVVGTFDTSGRAQARHLVYRSRLREWAEVFLVALAMALIMRAFLVQAFRIPSESMRPTLEERDRILVDKFFYHLDEPRRGDLVVFDSPDDPGTFYIKRVVGLPGETVTMDGDDVLLDGRPLAEEYRTAGPLGRRPDQAVKVWPVEPQHYFLLGDNRPNSSDSRVWGTLPRNRIVGRAVLRYWPPPRAGLLR